MASPDPLFDVRIEYTDGRSNELQLISLSNSSCAVASSDLHSGDMLRISLRFGAKEILSVDNPKASVSDNVCDISFRKEPFDINELNGMTNSNEVLKPYISFKDYSKISQSAFFQIEKLDQLQILAVCVDSTCESIFIGQTISNALLTIPTIGEEKVCLTVLGIFNTDGKLSVVFKLFSPENKIRRNIEQYILSCDRSSYPGKSAVGNRSKRSFSSSVRLEAISNSVDFENMLAVRKRAYNIDGRHAQLESFEDEYDKHSYILAAKIGDRMVGTVRCFSTTKSMPKYPFEKYLPLDNIYSNARSEYCELAKLAVLPEFRRSDIQILLMQEMTVRVLCMKKGAFCTATPRNSHFYLATGAVKISKDVQHPINPNEEYALYLYEKECFINLENMDEGADLYFAKRPIDYYRFLKFGDESKVGHITTS